ncbi:hypothetical protein HI914_00612 [Erysiphe necator]|nr:hypothetical protein HI914_00612 [Erysiphe necator]
MYSNNQVGQTKYHIFETARWHFSPTLTEDGSYGLAWVKKFLLIGYLMKKHNKIDEMNTSKTNEASESAECVRLDWFKSARMGGVC